MNNSNQKNVISLENRHTAHRLILYISMASITMFFAVTTSAVLVKKADVLNWAQFPLPDIFFISTIIAVASSLAFYFSYRLYQQKKFMAFRWMLALSGLISLGFLISQLLGFEALKDMGLPITGNVAGSFIYFLAIVHGLHIIGGLTVLLIMLVKAILARKNIQFEGSGVINKKRLFSMEILTSYWHFVNVLWVYLFLFFYFNYQ